MKTSSKIGIAVAVIAAIAITLAIVYRAVNVAPSASMPPDQRVLAIMEAGGCAECHVADPDLPFYANWPVARKVITEDIIEGYKHWDIIPMLKAIESRTAVNEVDLAKVQKAVEDGSMPLAKYYMVHWGSSLTKKKKDIMDSWISDHRTRFYPNPLASAEFYHEGIRPIPDAVEYDPEKAKLGELLYHDPRLSDDGSISCATCHGLNTGGVDNLKYSEGIDMQLGGVNAPTVFNAVFNFAQFWDGRARTLAEQAAGPPLNPVEMGCSSFDEIICRLEADRTFAADFRRSYPEGLTEATVTDAIEQYERTLVTPDCAFDRYLKGEKNALTNEEIKGYRTFKEFKCATCHTGINMGGLSYELMGQRKDYFKDRELQTESGLTDGDNGRWAQTGEERDRFRFKTPALRNVALTWPYYHDGSVNTLEEATMMMANYQVGRGISADEIRSIVTFLQTLTGEFEGKVLANENMKPADPSVR